MQARLQTNQFPSRAIAIVAFAAAIAGSGLAGYALKAPSVISGPTHVVTVSADEQPGTNSCVRLDSRKGC
jgi:hypothetical protein